MALEEISTYIAWCDGPSDLPTMQSERTTCPNKAKFENSGWGDDRYFDDTIMAQDMLDEGWYVAMSRYGNYPRKYAEVMCPACKAVAGE